MAENQFRLGLYINAHTFLDRAKESIIKSLKLDRQPKNSKTFDQRKLLYGNKTKIGIVKLESHMIAFFGTYKEKK